MQSPYRVNYKFSLEPPKKINWLSFGIRLLLWVPIVATKKVCKRLTFMEKVY